MIRRSWLTCGALISFYAAGNIAAAAIPTDADTIYEKSGVQGGLVIHIGCGDGKLTAALAQARYHVHGLDTSAERIAEARSHLDSLDRHDRVSVDHFDGRHLPYIDNLCNLVVAEDLKQVPLAEVMRVLAPDGVAYIRSADGWTVTRKKRPAEIDEWTHFLHDPSNNAVGHDQRVGPPRRLQWTGGPRYSRHHDKMSSVSAMVTAGGRVFYIFDEAPRFSILPKPDWHVIARDAFNGTVLWKRRITKWHSHLWPLKSGPAQLPRRLIAKGDRAYVTLAIDGPMVALDAATGKTLMTYAGTEGCEEALLHNGVLFALSLSGDDPQQGDRARRRGKAWEPGGWTIHALDADTGDVLWNRDGAVLPGTLAVDARHAVFHDGKSVVCLDRATGKERWQSDPVGRIEKIPPFFAPTLVLYQDVILFAGGEQMGKGGAWSQAADSMSALDAETGKVLWKRPHPASGYRSSEDVLVVDGLVWTGDTTSGRAAGKFTGRDPRTGEVKKSFEPDVDTYWFHHRCHRAKATDRFLLTSRTGIEFVDINKESWNTNHFVRGACLYGIMPANGLVYAPVHPCACYLEAKLSGFNALAPEATRGIPAVAGSDRLVEGPAFDAPLASAAGDEDWPTHRANAARTGQATTIVEPKLETAWRSTIGGKLTSPVIAEGKLLVASIPASTLHALNAATGELSWRFTAGAKIDSPPTVYQGRVFFGSADGWVYCLRATDGALAWKFLAATADQRTMSFGHVESLWPVHGSVLIQGDSLYCVAGRSMFLDGGLSLWRLDPMTGSIQSKTVLDSKEQGTGKDLQSFVSWLNMPTGLPDVLSSDGRFLYMRSQPFELDGKRLPLKPMSRKPDADHGAPEPVQGIEHAHLFSPTGFLDDSYWHRTYWMYGTMFVSGWQGYYRAGQSAPAGRILTADETTVYGFGRKPKYWRWTTPLEYHLFASPKQGDGPASAATSTARKPARPTIVTVPKSKALDTAGAAVTVSAWISPAKPDGVVLARGGQGIGFSLFLSKGQPAFAVRSGKSVSTATGKQRLKNNWAHLTGVLNANGDVALYVNGKLVSQVEGSGVISADPAEGLSIGDDDLTPVTSYASSAFGGLIDEVRVYRRVLNLDEIAAEAAGKPASDAAQNGLALALGFDDGKARDLSPGRNRVAVLGAQRARGRVGGALTFSGAGATTTTAGFGVPYSWTTDLPMLGRAMVLDRNGTIFIAGPEDLVDEERDARNVDAPETQRRLAAQLDAWAGKRGALLWAVSGDDGTKLMEFRLKTPPVFDGMAAANGRLFVCEIDGSVTCLHATKN